MALASTLTAALPALTKALELAPVRVWIMATCERFSDFGCVTVCCQPPEAVPQCDRRTPPPRPRGIAFSHGVPDQKGVSERGLVSIWPARAIGRRTREPLCGSAEYDRS